jgi:hypothetical protein
MAVSEKDRASGSGRACVTETALVREIEISGALTEENLFDGWNAHAKHSVGAEDPPAFVKEPECIGGADVFDDVLREYAIDNVIVVR